MADNTNISCSAAEYYDRSDSNRPSDTHHHTGARTMEGLFEVCWPNGSNGISMWPYRKSVNTPSHIETRYLTPRPKTRCRQI